MTNPIAELAGLIERSFKSNPYLRPLGPPPTGFVWRTDAHAPRAATIDPLHRTLHRAFRIDLAGTDRCAWCGGLFFLHQLVEQFYEETGDVEQACDNCIGRSA